jgi:IS605 OrfB family transposase
MIYIYKNLDHLSKDFENYVRSKFGLSDIEYDSALSKSKQIKKTFLSKIEKTKLEIDILIGDIKVLECKNKLTKKQTKTLFKLRKQLKRKNKFVKSDVVFGGKFLLKKISYLSNKTSEIQEEDLKIQEDLEKFKKKFIDKRYGTLYLLGEKHQVGNRFFRFDLLNDILIYRPYKGKEIVFNLHRRRNFDYERFVKMIKDKLLSVTVSINKTGISLVYDELVFSGYNLDKSKLKKVVKEITIDIINPDDKDDVIKEVYRNFHNELNEKRLENKVRNRFIGIDLNPDYLSYSIIDDLGDDYKIIEKGCYNLKKLNRKPHLSSDHPKTIHNNNKRVYEKRVIMCELFKKIIHYKVGYFVIEDLKFKRNMNNPSTKEFNRKVNNVWDRVLFTNSINTKCAENGITLIPIGPQYTSLIGNLSYEVFDPVASSIAITRRGIAKYNKKDLYPLIDESTLHTTKLVAKKLHLDVEMIKDLSWYNLYTTFSKYRYRWGKSVGEPDLFSVKSYKSRTTLMLY